MTRCDQIRIELQRIAVLPPDRPTGLSGMFYTDPAYFDWERRELLRRQWHCLGRADELPESGDHVALSLLGEALLMVRDDAGEIRVLSNLCRHRGMPLAEGRGQAKRFVCSYHAWTYGRDGALLRAPRMENAGFEPGACRLPEFASRLWRGFVYTCLAETPPPFAPAVSGLDGLLAPYEPEGFRLAHTAEEVWRTNWKCLVENFMEGYHLSVVHPQTLHGYTPTGMATKLAAGPGFTAYAANYPEAAAPRGTGAPGLSPAERRRSTLFAVFPTHVASQAASLLVSLALCPEAVDAVRVRWTLSVRDADLDAATVAERIALWEEVNREDREKLERLQAVLGSSRAEAGPLAGADYEGTIRDFHLWLASEDREAGTRMPAAI